MNSENIRYLIPWTECIGKVIDFTGDSITLEASWRISIRFTPDVLRPANKILHKGESVGILMTDDGSTGQESTFLLAVGSTKQKGTEGNASKLLESRILRIAGKYRRLTVRQFYYIMISLFEYPPGKQFYKRFNYHLSKLRRIDLHLDAKIVDRTRQFIPAFPVAFHQIELWVEKDAIRMQVEHLAAKYKISIQVLRGFGSLSMYRKALKRAAKSHVRKILYLGDFDPSGVHIEQVAAREMGIEIQRVAITPEQARRYKLRPIGVNRRDSRTDSYIQAHGNTAWELEAMTPRRVLKILDDELKTNVPQGFMRKAAIREEAVRIAKPVARRLVRKMEQEIRRMLKKGRSEQEIRKIMASRFRMKTRKKD